MDTDGSPRSTGPDRPRCVARYELDGDGLGWAIRVDTPAGEFAASASRLRDVELRACHTIRAVLGLDPADYDLELVHVLSLDRPARV